MQIQVISSLSKCMDFQSIVVEFLDFLNLWLGLDIANNCWILIGLFFIGYYFSRACSLNRL